MIYDLIIIGMGISGISAAIYAKRSNLNVLVVDKSMPGGLLNNIEMSSSGSDAITYYHTNLPEGTVIVGRDAFRRSKLTTIYIPDGVRSIETLAFEACRELTYVSVPTTVTNFGKAVFWNCEKLTSIDYRGTIEEASKYFSKSDESRFTLGSVLKTIHCSDGILEL